MPETMITMPDPIMIMPPLIRAMPEGAKRTGEEEAMAIATTDEVGRVVRWECPAFFLHVGLKNTTIGCIDPLPFPLHIPTRGKVGMHRVFSTCRAKKYHHWGREGERGRGRCLLPGVMGSIINAEIEKR